MIPARDHTAEGHVPGGHGHDHGPGGHAHAPANFGAAFAIGVALNAAFVVAEVVFGLIGHSVTLLADAGHNLSDALGPGVAWAAVILAKRKPTKRFTYGLGGTSILATLFNAAFLLVVTGALTWEALQRFSEPQQVAGKTVMIVAACGIVLNGFCAWLFASGRKGDLNVRGALAKVREFLLGLPGVTAVHDLHVWSLSTTEVALTSHLVTPGGHPDDETLAHAAEELKEHFGIGHVTLQSELKEPSAAHLADLHNA